MRSILVTGATGFIGNYVIEQLLKNDCRVTASSLSEEKARRFSWYKQVKYIPFDFASFDNTVDYYQHFNEPDVMIHLAWEGLPNYTDTFHANINLPRHIAFLRNLLLHGLTRLSVTGTCFEYGMQEGKLSEHMPSKPGNAYAVAKDRLRIELQALQAELHYNLTWIRLFYMYGKGQNPKSLFSQLEKALEEKAASFNMSGGAQIRDYLPVEKVAEYIVNISLQDKLQGIINCCSGKPVTVKQMVEEYLREHHSTMLLNLGYYPYTSYEPMAFWGDNKKLISIL